MIVSEESSRAVNEMGNSDCSVSFLPEARTRGTEHVSLRRLASPHSKYDGPIRTAFAALKTPYHRASVISRGKKSGHNPWQMDHQKAMDAKRGANTPLYWTDGTKTKYTELLN